MWYFPLILNLLSGLSQFVWIILATCFRFNNMGTTIAGGEEAPYMPTSGNFLMVWLIINYVYWGCLCGAVLFFVICANMSQKAKIML